MKLQKVVKKYFLGVNPRFNHSRGSRARFEDKILLMLGKQMAAEESDFIIEPRKIIWTRKKRINI